MIIMYSPLLCKHRMMVNVKGVGYRLKIIEVPHDFSKDSGVLTSEKSVSSKIPADNNPVEPSLINREEYVVDDREDLKKNKKTGF